MQLAPPGPEGRSGAHAPLPGRGPACWPWGPNESLSAASWLSTAGAWSPALPYARPHLPSSVACRGLPTPHWGWGGGRGWRSDLDCEGKEETCPVQYRFYKSCPRPQKETEDKTEGRGRPAPPPS